MKLTELQKAFRKNVIESLELFASTEAQLEYQRNVPIADVTAELFCGWEDSYGDGFEGHDWFRHAFSPPEQAALMAFDPVCQRVCDSLTAEFLPIEEFVLMPQAAELAAAATTALAVFEERSPEQGSEPYD